MSDADMDTIIYTLTAEKERGTKKVAIKESRETPSPCSVESFAC
jgi:hypothetical protein